MSRPKAYSKLIQLTHWLSAILIIGLFILGVWMVELSYYDDWYQSAPEIHKSFGVCLFIIMLLRLFARIIQKKPGAFTNQPQWQTTLSEIIHWLMYLCIFIILISGYLISTANGKAVLVFDWFSLPALIHYGETQADTAGIIHQYTAYFLIAIVVLHVSAFIRHQFFYKDQIIKRITPFN